MRVYWRHRYKTVDGLCTVANRSFSVEKNERDYARCQEFMSRQLREDFGGKAPESLLDLGYGQGHYAQVASEIGVRHYVGLDFAAPRLAMPGDYHFLEQDVCEEGLNLGEKFDVVLLLDVAFHVIDDLAFERLLANVSRHAQGVVFVTGLFRDQRMAAHVLHRRLEHFQSLGIVTSIYPWRDILLARIIHQPKKSTREGTFGGQDACQNNPSQEPRGPQTSSSDGQGAGQIGLIVTIGPNAPAQPSRG